MRVRTPVYLQQEAAECGAVALRIVLAYHGRYTTADELRRTCGVSRDGVRGDQLAQAARTYGLEARAFRKQPDSLKQMPVPFIAFMHPYHFVVVEGIERERVYVNDPALGRRSHPLGAFKQAYAGVVFTFTPTESFHKGGSRAPLWRSFVQQAAPIRWGLLFLSITALPLTLGGLAYAALVRTLFDDVGLRHNDALLLPLLVISALIGLLLTGFAWVRRAQSIHLEHAQNTKTSPPMLWRLLHLPDAFFTRRSLGEIASRFEAVESLSEFLSRDLSQLGIGIVGVSAYMLVLALYHPLIALISGGLLIVYAACTVLFLRRSRDAGYQAQINLGQLSASAVYSLQQIEQVKASGAEADVFQRLAGHYIDSQHAAQKVMRESRGYRAALTGITALNTLLTVLVGVALVRAGIWSVGIFAAAQALVIGVWGIAAGLSGLPGRVAFMGGTLSRLQDMPAPERPTAPPVPLLNGEICLENVTFGYKPLDPPLIHAWTETIAAGRSIGIIGASGSGKSTLARLMAGIYQPWQGSLQSGRAALVDQELFLFDGTMWENLTFWDHTLPAEQVIRAAQDAEIHADISALPMGYETPLYAQARNLSGGQRQRLQIARALATDPHILILDEATSALDPLLERRILEHIRRRGCTLIVISHRLSAVQDCDELWVIEQGKLVERGTAAELRERGGRFVELMAGAADSIVASADTPLMPSPSDDPPFAAPFMPERSIAHALKRLAQVETWRGEGPDVKPMEDSTLTAKQEFPSNWLRSLARESRADLRLLIVSAVFSAVVQLIPAVLISVLFNTAVPEAHTGLIVQIAIALIVCAAALILLNFTQETAAIRLQIRSDFRAQSVLWSRLLALPPAFFRRFSAGDLVTRMVQARVFSEVAAQQAIGAVAALLALIAAVIAIAMVYSGLFGWVVCLIAVYAVMLTGIGLLFIAAERSAVARVGDQAGWLTTLLTGVNHLQAARAVDRVFAVWVERFALLRHAKLNSRRAESLLNVIHTALPFAALLMLLAAVQSGSGVTLGTLIAAVTILGFITSNLTTLGNAVFTALRLIPAAERIAPILKQSPESSSTQRAVRPLSGEIIIRDVTFRYDAQPALQNVSIHLRAGEYVAIVGASGSGKSTLLRLLLGFEQPESGTITYDGQPIHTLDPASLRAQIGTVMQHTDLIHGASLFRNIAGMHQITVEQAWEALRFAGLADFVAALPMGIHTLLSEGGRTFSAGQRQRLLIARAVVRHPRLLFFDEATSAVDDETQAILIRSLSGFQGTRLVIAHRLSTVQHVDRIILLDKGQVIEAGTYTDLIARGGAFAEFARAQLLI